MTPDELDNSLPTPCGYKILLALPEVHETYEGSAIVRPKTMLQQEEAASVVGLVLQLGPDAYKDEKKFPTGPWCKEGDYVLVRSYSGTRFRVFGKEFRLINDDTVEGVVPSPTGYSRI
jgi:co-chaperonin GroES (HSP10)